MLLELPFSHNDPHYTLQYWHIFSSLSYRWSQNSWFHSYNKSPSWHCDFPQTLLLHGTHARPKIFMPRVIVTHLCIWPFCLHMPIPHLCICFVFPKQQFIYWMMHDQHPCTRLNPHELSQYITSTTISHRPTPNIMITCALLATCIHLR